MKQRTYITKHGTIHYQVSEDFNPSRITLVMLPGLTADHRLFDKQIEFFHGKYNLFVWDAPGHAASRPFDLCFKLKDKAVWLNEILDREGITKPVIVGQSMGGYVGQAFCQLYPDKLIGFIIIDSAPLQRRYITSAELFLLDHTEMIYKMYPWKLLLKYGSIGTAYTEYGRNLMADMMNVYSADHVEYARLVAHGYRMLADAIRADLPYRITCPAMLICGEKDFAGSTRRYNRAWHANTNIPIHWIKNAGHNSNTDQPEIINDLIQNFISGIKA